MLHTPTVLSCRPSCERRAVAVVVLAGVLAAIPARSAALVDRQPAAALGVRLAGRGGADPRRRRAGRPGLGGGDADRRVPAGAAGRGRSVVGEDRGPGRLHQGHPLHRRGDVRPRTGWHRRLGLAPRRAARRRRQLPRHLRHLPRPPERLRLRHQSRRGRVRRAGHPRRAGRRRADRRWPAIRGVGERLQRQLGRRLAGAIAHHRDRLDRRVRHSVQDAALPVGQRPDLGRQLPAHHPAPQRARLLGADPAPVQPLPGVAGRHAQRHHHPDAAEPQADSLRARQRHEVGRQAGRHRGRLRRRRRRQVQRHAEPGARRHDQHRLRPGRGRRPAGQPRSLQPVLPREAAVLPRERRLLLGRQPG